jgi:hypothetical protein
MRKDFPPGLLFRALHVFVCSHKSLIFSRKWGSTSWIRIFLIDSSPIHTLIGSNTLFSYPKLYLQLRDYSWLLASSLICLNCLLNVGFLAPCLLTYLPKLSFKCGILCYVAWKLVTYFPEMDSNVLSLGSRALCTWDILHWWFNVFLPNAYLHTLDSPPKISSVGILGYLHSSCLAQNIFIRISDFLPSHSKYLPSITQNCFSWAVLPTF